MIGMMLFVNFGPGVESALRTFASTLKVVKTSELKNINDRPVNYLAWLKKITGKVYFFIFKL